MINNSKDRIEKISFFLKKKNFNDAKFIIDQLILEQPTNVDFLNILGVIYLEQNEFYKAERIFLNIKEKTSRNYNADYNLGLLNERLLNLNNSLKFYLAAYSIMDAKNYLIKKGIPIRI